MKTYRTAEIAKMIGIHPNTVRLYETIGFISPPDRQVNGYRVFTERQLFELKLARLALRAEILHSGLRQEAVQIIKITATGKDRKSYALAQNYLAHLIKTEQEAETAVEVVQKLLGSGTLDQSLSLAVPERKPLKRQAAASSLGVTIDTLRNWELNGLLEVPRDSNGYRLYTNEVLERAIIIKSLRYGGYSLMSILRMLRAFERDGCTELRTVLDTPSESEDIISVCDRLLSCLREAKEDASEILKLLETVLE